MWQDVLKMNIMSILSMFKILEKKLTWKKE